MASPPSSEWDIVDEASLESFPASDPPAWGSHHAAASASTVALPEVALPEVAFSEVAISEVAISEVKPLDPRGRMRLARALVAAGIAVGGLVLLAMRLRRRAR